MTSRAITRSLAGLVGSILFLTLIASAAVLRPKSPGWLQHAKDWQHGATSDTAVQPLSTIHWQTSVDLDPPNQNGVLLVHYGSALCTEANTLITPVKTGRSGGFRIEAHSGANGALIWSQDTDYILPPHDWVPMCSAAVSAMNRVYFPGAGGTIYYKDAPDTPGGAVHQVAFYGLANYQTNPDAYNSTVFINTPITTDSLGNIYFGYQVTGANPLGLTGGIARISDGDRGFRISAATAAGDAGINKPAHNCGPALSPDGRYLYIAVSNGNGSNFGVGYLVRIDTRTMVPAGKVRLKDPKYPTNDAYLPDQGSACPTVGPDGDVYMGVLENPFAYHHDRGWLLHFNSTLTKQKTPGSFGWDDTASIVPTSAVPSYAGTSPYLLLCKYNNYHGIGGDGVNKVAIVDPFASMPDPFSGVPVMKDVITVTGVTPDPTFPDVKEWCINTAAVDPLGKCAIINSEDGKVYKWDFTTNSLSEAVTLTSGIGEAYTSTIIGVDGTAYAINNATLFAVGR